MTAHSPIDHPSAWRPGDFNSKDDYSFDLDARHRRALTDALGATRRERLDHEQMNQRRFELDAIEDDVQRWVDEVYDGRGFVVLRGFPVESLPVDDVGMMYFGLGTRFGRAVSQSSLGDLLGHVRDVAGLDGRERAYRNSRPLKLHTDRCDIIGMLCLRCAKAGGLSGYSSGLTVYNQILEERPDLIEPLLTGYRYHRFGEHADDEPPTTVHDVPIFSERDGKTSIVFLRAYMEMAAREYGETLSDQLVEALDLFEEVAERDDVRLDMMLEPGEVIFLNNCTMLHKRSGFEDDPDPALKRHLLRLWLMAPHARPMVDAVLEYKGEGGVRRKDVAATYYRGDAYKGPEAR